ncbi:MAG: copper resistance protein B [Acetobacterales bacterium]
MSGRQALAAAAFAAAVLAGPPPAAAASGMVFYGVQLEQFEYRLGDEDERLAVWDGDAFYGTDELKLRWAGKGEYDTRDDSFEKLENKVTLQTPVSDFFDAKAGVRLDTPEGPDRWYGVIGLAGLAPQWFEVDADLFVSERGDTSARLDVEYELLLTNRLVLTPSAEIDIAFSDDPGIGIGSGFTSAEAGLRLSYDVVDRLLSPYVGLVYETSLGDTADIAKREGEDVGAWFAVLGVKMLF